MRYAVASMLLCLLVGCSGEEETSDAATPDAEADAAADTAMPIVLRDIDVQVSASADSFDGELVVAAFLDNPPDGPPLALSRETMPTFPTELGLRGLEPGTVWVIGVLDSPPASPTLPGPEDLTAEAGPIEVAGDDPLRAELFFDIP